MDIRKALRTQTAAALAIAGDATRRDRPPLITVASVTRAAGRGRSQLYNAFPYLLDEIREANQRVEVVFRATNKVGPRTKESLSAELRRLRRESKMEVARLASTQLTDLLRRMGPEFRKTEISVARVATLKRKLKEAEDARATLSAINEGWMKEVNRRPDFTNDG
jgi:uncharacterized protein (DUF2164 family)